MDIYGNTLKLVSETIADFEKRQGNAINIHNWVVQLMGNDRVKSSVTVTATIQKKVTSVTFENFQPGRFLNKGAFVNVVGGHSEAPKILEAYVAGGIPNPAKECLALIGYFTTLNILGKPISATSGGRAVLLSKILATLKPEKLEVAIAKLGSGGQGDSFSLTLGLPEVTSLANGGKWRGELVLALPAGGKKANSGGSVTDAPIADEWA